MTLGLKITNNFSAPLAAGINSAATTVTLSAGYGARLTQYAAGEYEYMTLVDQSNNMEIVKVTSRTGDILTIIRAQDGTSARDFIVGDICTSRPCRAALYDAMEVNLAKANVDSQAFTGTPSLPTGATGVTQTQGNNSTKLATTAYTDAAKAAAIAYVDAAVATKFESAELDCPLNGNISAAHSLGVVPTLTQAVFRCKNASNVHGYAVGDDVVFAGDVVASNSAGTVWANSTNVGLSVYLGRPNIAYKNGTSNATLETAYWKVVLKAIKIA